ncbi:MAG: DUF3347 domain-containing protein [Ferruginibacter sp.]
MKKLLLILVLIIATVCVYYFSTKNKTHKNKAAKQVPLALKIHSAAFNTSVDNAMDAYLDMKNAFVDADTANAKSNARSFIKYLDSIPVIELKNDTAMIFETAASTIMDIKSNAESLLQQTDITEMRRDFSMVTEMLYPAFFKTINYEGENLYFQHCPMAFDDDKGANWISDNKEIINPYLGKKHPKYKGSMLHCGETKDTIKAQ